MGESVGPSPTPSPSASSSDTAGGGGDLDIDQLLRSRGLNPHALPAIHLNVSELLTFIIITALVVLVLRATYRGMQRPRIELTDRPTKPPKPTWKAVGRYLLTPLFLVPLWYFTMLAILLLAAGRGVNVRPPEELVMAAAIVVGASRLLAHLNAEGAHELAKTVPLTLVSLVLVSGSLVGWEGLLILTLLIGINIGTLFSELVVLGVWDILLTLAWVIWRRMRWYREQRPPGDHAGFLARVWEAVASGWGQEESGPDLEPAVPAGSHGSEQG